MMNPLFSMMMNNNPMLQQFNQFKNTFRGDARSEVQQLLNSGRISQEQYNQAVQMANQLQKMLGR